MSYKILKKLRNSTYVALKVEGMDDDDSIRDYYKKHGTFKHLYMIGHTGNQQIIDAIKEIEGQENMSYTDEFIDDFRSQLRSTFDEIADKSFEAGEESGIDYAIEGKETYCHVLPNTDIVLWHLCTDKRQVFSYQDMLDYEIEGFESKRPDGSVVYLSEGREQIEFLADKLMKMAKEFKDRVESMEWYE